jgi:sulfur-carrier protein adenylyltransferase/sulfurtransferase
MQDYYQSHQKLPFIGEGGQAMLQQQKVLVAGAGGLGCPCLTALAGAGIGSIGIADFDVVAISNLHRQPLYMYQDTGKPKALAAAAILAKYNPFIHIVPHVLMLDENNVLPLLKQYDIIVDCTDNFYTRYLLNDACVYLNKPLVYGAIHQGEGHVTVFNYQQGATLRCLFPKDEHESIPSCAQIGAYNIATCTIGSLMANEVIKIALQHPAVLAGKIQQLDMVNGTQLTIACPATPQGRQKSMQRFAGNLPATATIAPANVQLLISNGLPLTLLDVRETAEHHTGNIGGINIPLAQILQCDQLPFTPAGTLVVYCQKGQRSLQAVSWLRQNGYQQAVSLQGGIEHYLQITL